MKKILISFCLGLLLSVVPIMALESYGKTIKLCFEGECPEFIYQGSPLGGNYCIKTGESESCDGGVCVCSYSCKIVGAPIPIKPVPEN